MHGAHCWAQGTWLLSNSHWPPLLPVTFSSVSKLLVSRWEGLRLPSPAQPLAPFPATRGLFMVLSRFIVSLEHVCMCVCVGGG